MRLRRAILGLATALAACWFLGNGAPSTQAYIDVPPRTLGHMCSYSSDIAVLKVESVHPEKKAVVFRQVQVLRGKWPAEAVRHFVVSKDVEPLLQVAKPGMTAVTFYTKTDHNAGYTYIGGLWYVNRLFVIDSKVQNDVGKWEAYLARPSQLRTFSGEGAPLITAVTAILKGEEVVVPCMVADKNEDLAAGRGKAKNLRASLKRLEYDPKRDAAD